MTAKHGGTPEQLSRTLAPSRPATERTGPASQRADDEGDIVLVDASNVAHSTEGEQPQLDNILAVRRKLADEGKEPILVADAALRHQIDKRGEYEKLVDQGIVRQAPAGTDADFFLLSFARELDARIVSNDRFRDRAQQFPDALDRLVRYMIVENEVVFEWRARRRDD